jgi:hypothetical protein
MKVVKIILFGLLGIFVIFIVIPLIMGILSSVNPNKAVQMAKQKTTENSIQKIEGTSYTFFYPQGYEVVNEEGKDLNYINKNSQAVSPESIFLFSTKRNGKISPPTYQMCADVAEKSRQKQDDEITAEVAYGGYEGSKGSGCKITVRSKINDINDTTVSVEKDLWYESGKVYSLYAVRAVYFGNASKNEAAKLNLAVDQFGLK